MEKLFAPGCALVLYKPALAKRVENFLQEQGLIDGRLGLCCLNLPPLQPGTRLIDVCPGCNRRFGREYPEIELVSLWEILLESDFPFPDYSGLKLALHDPCPAREKPRIHNAVRQLLRRMNIQVLEPELTKKASQCCGDSFFAKVTIPEILLAMKDRAGQMPADEVAVYCVSCIKSMHNGGKTPRYLLDLLFAEPTEIQAYHPEEWHKLLDDYIAVH
ncbi:MAG: (Fe-S)-binding protein [Clostridiales bacterium]|jgi:Fe-S oxidoreductase|nr:(Fe-S)-binding protein [Clostridiales bacterium]MDR2713042.1 (Fe-S)-binding protein [Clostridiales bacterium]